MLRIWIALSFIWTGAVGLKITSSGEGLCLEDSSDLGLHLQPCSGSSALQQWMWMEPGLLVNKGTQRCLSASHGEPAQTKSCVSGDLLGWECRGHQLIETKSRMMLSKHRGEITLHREEKGDEWSSLDTTDICRSAFRSKRESEFETEDLEFSEEPPAPRMSEEQARFLQWYYRTEDTSSWKFGMLGFAFVGLLIGSMLMVMGMMANRNRKQLAKYKAASKVTEEKEDVEELQVIISEKNEEVRTNNSHKDWEEASADGNLSEEMKPGEIKVTWKDGNKSTLYPEPVAEEDKEELTNRDLEDHESSQNTTQVIASSETIAF